MINDDDVDDDDEEEEDNNIRTLRKKIQHNVNIII